MLLFFLGREAWGGLIVLAVVWLLRGEVEVRLVWMLELWAGRRLAVVVEWGREREKGEEGGVVVGRCGGGGLGVS